MSPNAPISGYVRIAIESAIEGFRAARNGNLLGMKRTLYAMLGRIAWTVGRRRVRSKVRAVGRW
jgi:hypothetical protein